MWYSSKQRSIKHYREFHKGPYAVCGEGALEEIGRKIDGGKALHVNFTALRSYLGPVDNVLFLFVCFFIDLYEEVAVIVWGDFK